MLLEKQSNVYHLLQLGMFKIRYKFIGGLRNTRIIAGVYIIGNLIISSFKIALSIHVVVKGDASPLTFKKTALPGWVAGRVIDVIWMLFNAVIPFVVAFVRARSEPPLTFEIGMKNPKFIDDETDFLSPGDDNSQIELTNDDDDNDVLRDNNQVIDLGKPIKKR